MSFDPAPVNTVFAKTLDALALRGAITLFVRDDDVDGHDDNLRRLMDLCAELRVPLSLAIVPGLLDDEAGSFLLDAWRQAPELLEFHQHGWRHQNHEAAGSPAEFGPSRSFQQQREDIRAGQCRMREIFGDGWYAGFTPPWHAATPDTLRALTELGFEAFSSSVDQVLAAPSGLCLVPATLDLEFELATPSKPRSETVLQLFEQILDHQFVGLVLHHKVMQPAAFAFLKSFLAPMAAHPGIRLATLRSLAQSDPSFRFTGAPTRFRTTTT